MRSDTMFFIALIASFLPFALFVFLNNKANMKKEIRYKQFPVPVFAVVYCAALLIFMKKIAAKCMELVLRIIEFVEGIGLSFVAETIRNIYTSWGVYLVLVLFNTLALLVYVIVKRSLTASIRKINIRSDGFIASAVGIFYSWDEQERKWYIREHFGQARTFIKAVYYGSCAASALALLASCGLSMNQLISAPFYPVFAVIIIGELAFYIDGLKVEETKSTLNMQADRSRHVAMYPLLRKPLKDLFGDKLSADGTTVNNAVVNGGSVEDILAGLESSGGHIGRNYAAFIRKKAEGGLKPSVDYVRSGYDMATGKSLLFNTPFYDKLNPYVFYAMNREMLTGGKVLVVLGRHGTEEDLYRWCENGMLQVSNIPKLWKIRVLNGQKCEEDDLPDIGIISRSGVHDLDIHKSNLPFLNKVSFVVIIEPSRLVTTAQIGLNLLVKCCGKERPITFCSVDRNCDGLVDALSHILMANITEVSATEYPHGMSSYMYWTADGDYLQHRILPGVSRYLGMGTELSMVALKNQVKKTIWYGGDAFPVSDAHWIAKQYYYDLLDYAKLPTNQESFDKYFQTSFNMCDEKVSDYSFISVEDDRNNLFETRRNFATIAEQQGFVNVISSEYMLREYMAANTEMFTADAKAIPYITADYARTKRNAILSLCLLMCIDSVREDALERQMLMLNISTKDPAGEVWKEICTIFSREAEIELDRSGNPILTATSRNGNKINFRKDSTILYKREYSVETGRFESVYTIEDADFAHIILDDLQNAVYVAEEESKDVYLGTELKGHIYQKYLPGQFFTLSGKYYEMVSATSDNRIMVRRASEHIGGRLSYRQIRNYIFHHIQDFEDMGALKTVNNIDIHYQHADFSVETPGYWKLSAHNDFDSGSLVTVNGVPNREYHHKQVLRFDFSKLGDAFTDSVRMTLTNLLNETFVTLFAENRPFISAITPGSFDAPITYSMSIDENVEMSEKCIYIVEDSQMDIGLLVAVERNINRILQIIAEYLAWNDEQIAESLRIQNQPEEKHEPAPFNVYEEAPEDKKKPFFKKIGDWFKGVFGKIKKKLSRKKGEEEEKTSSDEEKSTEDATESAEKEKNAEAVTESAEKEKSSETSTEGAEEEKNSESTAESAVAETGEAISEGGDSAEAELSPRERKKAAKAAAKAEKKAAKAAAKAEKKARREEKKAQKKNKVVEEEKIPSETESEQPDEAEKSGEAEKPDATEERETVTVGAQSEAEVNEDE